MHRSSYKFKIFSDILNIKYYSILIVSHFWTLITFINKSKKIEEKLTLFKIISHSEHSNAGLTASVFIKYYFQIKCICVKKWYRLRKVLINLFCTSWQNFFIQICSSYSLQPLSHILIL